MHDMDILRFAVAGLFVVCLVLLMIIMARRSRFEVAVRQEADKLMMNRRDLLAKDVELAQQQAGSILEKANAKANAIVSSANERAENAEKRIERLKLNDVEMQDRLRTARNSLGTITDMAGRIAGDIEVVTEEDLLSSQAYQADRKDVMSQLKKLAVDAIVGVDGSRADVNITRYASISAKADIAGALLLTTVEMLSSKVKHNTGEKAIEKLSHAISASEVLVKSIDSRARINPDFKSLLVKRLELEIKYKRAKQLAREQQREIRDQQREEVKARKEAEKVQKEAEKEEAIKKQAIENLMQEMSEKSEAERLGFQAELDALQAQLDEAHERFERAKSRAQETKQGHVYIISNVGSFGEDILKIGMTRRMEPLDRIKELGDASVPFSFDVHAMIEAEDAPSLEKLLHHKLHSCRVNKVNYRKEFFSVSIDEIEKCLNDMDVDALLNRVASADEYYQSLRAAPAS